MICKNCNTLNSNDALECINCGEKIEKRISPFAPRVNKTENVESIAEKIPKVTAKRAPSQLLIKLKKDNNLFGVLAFSVLLFSLVVIYIPFTSKLIDIIISPIVNLTNNISLSIGEETEVDYSALLNNDIIAAPVKKVVAKPHTALKNVTIRPAEIKKDKVMEYYICHKDSMKMILIPAGETEIGSNSEGVNEKPLHRVFVNAFFIDQHEITNLQYRKFVLETGYKMPRFMNDSRFNGPSQPVVGVTYEDAANYARWAGKRLPTEEEWERAARSGQNGLVYTNGSTITPNSACYDLSPDQDEPSEVKSYGHNPYFLYDLIGNAAEWTQSVPKAYSDGKLDKEYGANYRIVKGGSWKNIATDVTIAKRDIKGVRWNNNDIGFRCVMDY